MKKIEGLTPEQTINFFEWYLEKNKKSWFCVALIDFLFWNSFNKLIPEEQSENLIKFLNYWISELKFNTGFNFIQTYGTLFKRSEINGTDLIRQDFAKQLLVKLYELRNI